MPLRNHRSRDPWVEVLRWLTVAFMPLRSCKNPSLLFVFLWITKTGDSKDFTEGSACPSCGYFCTRSWACFIFSHERAIDQSIQGHQRPKVVFKSVWLALDQ